MLAIPYDETVWDVFRRFAKPFGGQTYASVALEEDAIINLADRFAEDVEKAYADDTLQ